MRSFVIIATVLSIATTTSAQERAPQQHNVPPREGTARQAVALDFKGGTLADYIRAMSGKGTAPNVILDAEIGTVKVPPVVLKDVSFGNALRAVAATSEARERGIAVQILEGGREGGQDVIILTSSLPSQMTRPAVQQQSQRPAPVQRIARAWSARQWGEAKQKGVVTALHKLFASIASTENRPGITFDESLELVIITGSPEHVEMAGQLINEVQVSQPIARSESSSELRRLTEEVDALKAAVLRLTQGRPK